MQGLTVAAAVPVFVPDVPAAVLTAMALASAVQAVAIDTVSTAPEFPVEPAAAVPVVSVFPVLPVQHAAELLHAAAVSAAAMPRIRTGGLVCNPERTHSV